MPGKINIREKTLPMSNFFKSVLHFAQKARASMLVANMGWNVLGNLASRAIRPVFSILVARLLMPKEYGIFGIAMAMMALLNLCKDLGLTQAIIVNAENENSRSLQFTVQLFWGTILYLIVFAASRFLGNFFNMPELPSVLKLLGLGLFVAAFEDPLLTFYMKKMNYRLLFFRQLIPSVVFGVTALTLAYMGAGVYALVFGTLVSGITTAAFLIVSSRWKPKIYFVTKEFFRLFRLGKHIMFQRFCGFLVLQADSLIIGKNLGAADVGFYRMGTNLTQLVPNSIMPQIQQVVFTDLSRRKGDLRYLAKRYYQFVYILGLAALLFSIFLFLFTPLLVPLVLGAKWKCAVFVVQIMATQLPFIPLVLLNSDISKIYGFNHIYSYFSALRAIVTVIGVGIASLISLKITVYAWALIGALSPCANAFLFFKYQNMIHLTKWVFIVFCLCWLNLIVCFYVV